MLRVMLNRHPELAVCGETKFLPRIYSRRSAFGDLARAENRTRAVEAYLATNTARRLGMDVDVLRKHLMEHALSYRDFFAAMLDCYAGQQGKMHGGEKTPQHALHAKMLCDWFPECTVIHLVRDPRDSVSSLMNMPWSVHSVLVCARIWRSNTAAACSISSRSNYLRLKYEELVREPEVELRRVCGRLGIGWSAEMVEPAASAEPDGWWHRRAHQALTSTRVGSWHRELEPWQAAVVERTAGPWMEELGYERREPRAAAEVMMRAVADAVMETGLQKLFQLPSLLSAAISPAHLAREERLWARAVELYGRVRLSAAARSTQPARR